jgi:hypothetical protein
MFHRVLVVGLSSAFSQRCDFEYAMVSELASDGSIAGASCDYLTPQDPLTRPSIEKAVKAFNADAVVTTRVVDANFKAVKGAGRDDQGGAAYNVTSEQYVDTWCCGYGVEVTYSGITNYPPITTVEAGVDLITRVYATSDAKMVYTITTKSSSLASEEDFVLDVPPKIAARLRHDGVVP